MWQNQITDSEFNYKINKSQSQNSLKNCQSQNIDLWQNKIVQLLESTEFRQNPKHPIFSKCPKWPYCDKFASWKEEKEILWQKCHKIK